MHASCRDPSPGNCTSSACREHNLPGPGNGLESAAASGTTLHLQTDEVQLDAKKVAKGLDDKL